MSTKKLIVIALAIFLLPAILIAVAAAIYMPDLKKLVNSTVDTYQRDDVEQLQTLDTSTFKCSYPKNWTLRTTKYKQHTEHYLHPIGGAFVYIYEFPKFSEEDPEDLGTKLTDGLKSMSTGVEESTIKKWGHYKGIGHRMVAQILAQPFEITSFRMKSGTEGAEVMVLVYKSARDNARRGFNTVEQTFQLKPRP